MTVIGKKDKVIIELDRDELSVEEIQSMLDWIRYKKIVSKSKATQKDIDNLASDVNKKIYKEHYSKLKK